MGAQQVGPDRVEADVVVIRVVSLDQLHFSGCFEYSAAGEDLYQIHLHEDPLEGANLYRPAPD